MNKETLKNIVKEYFNLVEVAPDAPIVETFGEIKDINGAFTVKFPGDALEVGTKVTIVTAEGQEMDAPDGTHELEDGTKIVTVNSIVTEIIPVELPNTDAGEVDLEAMEEVVTEPSMTPEYPSIEDIVSAVIDVVKEEMKKYEEKMKALETKMSEFASMPASEKTLPKEGKTKMESFSAVNEDVIKIMTERLKNKKTTK